MSDDENYKYEVTIALNNPNLFLFIDENGRFKVEGYSSWCSTVWRGLMDSTTPVKT